MNPDKLFVVFIVTFIVISGCLGYWVYDISTQIEEIDANIVKQNKKFNGYMQKSSKLSKLEDRFGKLSVGKTEIDLAMPNEGEQAEQDIMAMIYEIKSKAGSNFLYPSVMSMEADITGIKDEFAVVDNKKKKRNKTKVEFRTITIKVKLKTTWLGILQFLDLLEKDKQIFNVVSLTGDGKDYGYSKLTPSEIRRKINKSPFENPYYGGDTDIVIETYHYIKKDKKK